MLKKTIKIGVVAVLGLTATHAISSPQLSNAESINAVIAEMTLEEKAKFVVGTGMNNAQFVAGAAGSTFAIPRLGIPQVVMADGPVGVRLGAGPTGGAPRYATAFPVSSALASTWNDDLIYQVAAVMGDESKAFGVDLLLAPALNIQRDPLNGRNFEYFSEDPLLSGRITAAFVNGIQSKGIGATVKHFIANNQETNRQSINQVISERALREIYLAGFEYAIKQSQPWAVMSSYPSVNGTFVSQNPRLLQDILRNEWGFKGLVMSDWYGVKDPVKALPAGNDLIMPGGLRSSASSFQGINRAPEDIVAEALKSGELTEAVVNNNIRSILNVILKTAVFNGNKPIDNPNIDQHAATALAAAQEGIILLKNSERTLPITTDKQIALFGRNVSNFYIGGGGSAEVNAHPDSIVTLKDGLSNAGYQIVASVNDMALTENVNSQYIVAAAHQSDIALIAIGRSSSEGADRYSMELHDDEIKFIKEVSAVYRAMDKKVVILLNIGAPVEMMEWDNNADAILLLWQPGQQGGNATADILSGKISPSGKLPVTIAKYYRDVPSYGNFPGYAGTVNYGEGIYVGYRYYDTRNIEPMYPFGHGLSYTSFSYENPILSNTVFDLDTEEAITFTIDVTNTGNISAKEVVQLYIHDPASRIDRPMQELRDYKKLELKPGEKQTVSFSINKRALAFYDEEKNNWVVEPGRFVVKVGSSSRDIHNESQFRAISVKNPALSLATPWINVQTYKKAADIVARYIGDDETNGWIRGMPTLSDKMESYFNNHSELKENKVKQIEILSRLIAELNEL